MDPIQSFLDDYEQSEDSIPAQSHPTCCCGNEDCAYLQHNQSALEGLEKDVSTAARLGKALLMRHEAYIADSERERKAMTAHIETLEAEKLALEKKNATVIEENRNLLDQLEALNSAVSDSDAHVVSLQTTLQSTQQELHKLSQLAARTEWLERQLADFEREQANWQTSLESKEESEKSAIRRWQTAERTLANLQDQIERIEREAKEEKDRHREIVERMERRHAVEKELGSAAGRLKSAAALKNGNDAGGPTVVSHFVKDILQDNANLQMGIVELREMLNNSNEEVESLRDQLQMHQPTQNEEESHSKSPLKRKDLREEMSRANSQELHVHHHYHAPPAAPKPQSLRRPKKKRVGAFTGHFTPSSGTSTPRSSFSYGSPTPTATILNQTAASVPQQIPRKDRWSTQSNMTYQSVATSSGPSSPRSTTNRTSSIFDRVFSDAGLDSSRPTTPETEEPGSPTFAPVHSKKSSQSSFRTHSMPLVARGGINTGYTRPTLDAIVSVEDLAKAVQTAPNKEPIPEEAEHDWQDPSTPEIEVTSSMASPMSDEAQHTLYDQSFHQRPLRKAASHESILSVSGVDIHTLKSRPSQLLAPYGGRGFATSAVISDTNAHAALPTAMSRPTATGRTLLSGMAADKRQPAATATPIGKKVGGWIFGKWGGATPTSNSAEASPATAKKVDKPDKSPVVSTAKNGDKTDKVPDKPGSVSSASDKHALAAQLTPKKLLLRASGVNQSGPLLGFFPEAKSPPKEPVMTSLDQEALSDVLGGS